MHPLSEVDKRDRFDSLTALAPEDRRAVLPAEGAELSPENAQRVIDGVAHPLAEAGVGGRAGAFKRCGRAVDHFIFEADAL